MTKGEGMEKMLVVDDDELVGRATKTLLETLFPGIEVVYKNSPRDAHVGLMLGDKFDIVVTDFLMPEIDGVKIMIAAMICSIPVLGMSADADDFQERVLLALEDENILPRQIAFMKKPFGLSELRNSIEKLFGN